MDRIHLPGSSHVLPDADVDNGIGRPMSELVNSGNLSKPRASLLHPQQRKFALL